MEIVQIFILNNFRQQNFNFDQMKDVKIWILTNFETTNFNFERKLTLISRKLSTFLKIAISQYQISIVRYLGISGNKRKMGTLGVVKTLISPEEMRIEVNFGTMFKIATSLSVAWDRADRGTRTRDRGL